MAGCQTRDRHLPDISSNIVEAPTRRPCPRSRTVAWNEVSERPDNEFILSRYRRKPTNYLETFKSLTFLHNETGNVYTHLIGALLLPLVATAFLRDLHRPQFVSVSGADYFMFGLFFCCAECCLVFSAGYHLMGSYSHNVEQVWHSMDLLGIVIVTVATFFSGIYYVFFCEPHLQKLHWIIVSIFKCAPSLALHTHKRIHGLRYADLDYRYQPQVLPQPLLS